MGGHLFDVQHILNNGQKSDSFAAHYGKNFNSTMSNTDLYKCMKFKIVNQINPIESMKPFKKSNCSLFI